MKNLFIVKEKIKCLMNEVATFQLKSSKSDFNIETKSSDIDFVTDIDKKSDEMIIEFIKKNFSDFKILTEEHGYLGNSESKYCFVIDPIDGTTNYAHNYPLHCISIGLKYEEKVVFGMVYLPVLKMNFYAIKNHGAYLNDEKIFVSKTNDLNRSILSTGFPYSRAIDNPNLYYFNKIINKIAGIRRSGSAAIDVCFCAAGFTDGYFEFNINEWDYCAGKCILEEAGGSCEMFIFENNKMFLFSNSAINHKIKDVFFSENNKIDITSDKYLF